MNLLCLLSVLYGKKKQTFLKGNCFSSKSTSAIIIPSYRSNHFVDFFQRHGGLQRPQEFYCLTGCKELNCNHLERINRVIIKSFPKLSRLESFLTFSTFLTTWRAFLAANPPIDTWSSVPALVDKESTDAGWHKVLFSDTEIKEIHELTWYNYFLNKAMYGS